MKRATVINIVTITLIIVIVIIGSISAVVAAYSVLAGERGDSQLYFLGYKPVIVITGSMNPAIQVNSLSIAKKCSINEVKLGDIVMYRNQNGVLVTHRVIEITKVNGNRAMITKGDANKYQDINPVTAGSLQSKIVYTANYMVPIISEIMPEPGTVNTIAIFRSIIILSLLVLLIATIITGISKIVTQVYWVSTGNGKYERILEEYRKNIQTGNEIYEEIHGDIHKHEGKFRLIDKILIGICRANMVKHFNNIKKQTNRLNKQAKVYHKVYDNALVHGAARQQRIVDRLKNSQSKLANNLENEENIRKILSRSIGVYNSNGTIDTEESNNTKNKSE